MTTLTDYAAPALATVAMVAINIGAFASSALALAGIAVLLADVYYCAHARVTR